HDAQVRNRHALGSIVTAARRGHDLREVGSMISKRVQLSNWPWVASPVLESTPACPGLRRKRASTVRVLPGIAFSQRCLTKTPPPTGVSPGAGGKSMQVQPSGS